MNDEKFQTIPNIISTEIPNSELMLCIIDMLKDSTVGVSIEDGGLEDYFKKVFDALMHQDGYKGHQFLNRNKDIDELTNKAVEFFNQAKTNISFLALLEVLYLSVSSASANYFKDKGESNKTIDKFRVFSSQLNWLNKKHRNILARMLDLRKPGGDTASRFPWSHETCELFITTVDKLKPLWECITSFYKARRGVKDRFALLKEDQNYQGLSKGYDPKLIEEVISRMLNLQAQELKKKRPNRSLLSPLAFACEHAASELSMHSVGKKPYSLQTLINYYHSINREIENGTLIEPTIFEYRGRYPKPPQE